MTPEEALAAALHSLVSSADLDRKPRDCCSEPIYGCVVCGRATDDD